MDAEDDEDEIHIRLGSVLKALRRHLRRRRSRAAYILLSLAGRDAAPRHGRPLQRQDRADCRFTDQLLQAAGDLKPKMIGIASAANIFAGNENDRSQVQRLELCSPA